MSDLLAVELSDPELRAKLIHETAKISWVELEKFFAGGVVIKVAGSMDLIEVAVAVSADHSEQVRPWMDSGQLVRASVEDAQDWHSRDPELWAVVTAPWVLVQERTGKH